MGSIFPGGRGRFNLLSIKYSHMKKKLLGFAVIALVLFGCKGKDEKTLSGLLKADFKKEIGKDTTGLYLLKNAAGMEVCVTNFGGRIVSIMVPDKAGKLQDVVLGFDSVADYINVPSDFGASIGRYANRINKGLITIDGKTIQLPQNNFGHCLHGGPKGWQYQVYQKVNQIDATTIEMTRFSPDGDQNFPGNVTAKVTYKLTEDNAIDINRIILSKFVSNLSSYVSGKVLISIRRETSQFNSGGINLIYLLVHLILPSFWTAVKAMSEIILRQLNGFTIKGNKSLVDAIGITAD